MIQRIRIEVPDRNMGFETITEGKECPMDRHVNYHARSVLFGETREEGGHGSAIEPMSGEGLIIA